MGRGSSSSSVPSAAGSLAAAAAGEQNDINSKKSSSGVVQQPHPIPSPLLPSHPSLREKTPTEPTSATIPPSLLQQQQSVEHSSEGNTSNLSVTLVYCLLCYLLTACYMWLLGEVAFMEWH